MVHPSAFRTGVNTFRNPEYENGAWYFDQNGQGYQLFHGEWEPVHTSFTPEEGINRDWQSPEGGYTRYAPGDIGEDVPLISPSTEGSNSPYNEFTHGQLPRTRESRNWEMEVDNYFDNYDLTKAAIDQLEYKISSVRSNEDRILLSEPMIDLLTLKNRLHQLRRYNPLQLNFETPMQLPSIGNRPGLDFYPNDYQEIASIRRRVRALEKRIRHLL